MPILPVAIDGTGMPGRGNLDYRGKEVIHVQFGDPIYPDKISQLNDEQLGTKSKAGFVRATSGPAGPPPGQRQDLADRFPAIPMPTSSTSRRVARAEAGRRSRWRSRRPPRPLKQRGPRGSGSSLGALPHHLQKPFFISHHFHVGQHPHDRLLLQERAVSPLIHSARPANDSAHLIPKRIGFPSLNTQRVTFGAGYRRWCRRSLLAFPSRS